MKTTMNIPDPLYKALKQQAAAEGRTVTSIVEQAIRETTAAPTPRTTLPTWSGGSSDGYLVDLDDADALWHAMDTRP